MIHESQIPGLQKQKQNKMLQYKQSDNELGRYTRRKEWNESMKEQYILKNKNTNRSRFTTELRDPYK